MRRLLLALSLLALPALAEEPSWSELALLSEHPVEGMSGGNLSGLAWCQDALWAVSDRVDERLYRLVGEAGALQADAQSFAAPPPPDIRLPWGLRMRNWVAGTLRGGHLDFEGLSCDAAGNRYLVSEARMSVLMLPVEGEPRWLSLPSSLLRQARASGMLLHYNSMFEGIAVDPSGERLWLAAERMRRGLLALQRQRSSWRCSGSCVLLSESGETVGPEALGGKAQPLDFSALAFYQDKLFTLERQAHRICRRQLSDAAVERCWSFAAVAVDESRRYPVAYGMAEALWVDKDGAWVGVDNGRFSRTDGESRPVVWRFAAPSGGWSSRQ